jgi:rubrerythrin
MKIEKKKMTLAQFAEFAKAEADAMAAAPDAERAALLRANLAKAATVEKADAEFEVDVAVAPDAGAPALDLSGIAAKLDKIDAAVAAFAGGVTAKALYDGVVAKQGIAMQLAVELLTAYQAKVAGLVAQLQAGGSDLDRDKVWSALSSYDVGEAVNMALAAVGKAEGAPDATATAEVGEVLKAALIARAASDAEATRLAAEAAKKAADEAAAKAKADAEAAAKGTCEQCGAAMADDAEVCPECGWKRGTPVSKRAHRYPDRYDGAKKE